MSGVLKEDRKEQMLRKSLLGGGACHVSSPGWFLILCNSFCNSRRRGLASMLMRCFRERIRLRVPRSARCNRKNKWLCTETHTIAYSLPVSARARLPNVKPLRWGYDTRELQSFSVSNNYLTNAFLASTPWQWLRGPCLVSNWCWPTQCDWFPWYL